MIQVSQHNFRLILDGSAELIVRDVKDTNVGSGIFRY